MILAAVALATVVNGPVFQPLALGDRWTYVCHDTHDSREAAYTITNAVIGVMHVSGHEVFEFAMQVPVAPTKINTIIQLLSNDSKANTWLYGYLIDGTVHPVQPALIVASDPVTSAAYSYPDADDQTIRRTFMGPDGSNPTPWGTYRVAPYFESDATHNYGYARGIGIVEEDHGLRYQYDCVISSLTLKG